MDSALKEKLDDLISCHQKWTPKQLLLRFDQFGRVFATDEPGGSGVVNVLDYVGEETKLPENVLLEFRAYTNPSRDVDGVAIADQIIQSAAMEGFHVVKNGGRKKGDRRVRIECYRHRIYTAKTGRSKDARKPPRNSKTSLPFKSEFCCPLRIVLKYSDLHGCWYLQGGEGCRHHRHHSQREGGEVTFVCDDDDDGEEVVDMSMETTGGLMDEGGCPSGSGTDQDGLQAAAATPTIFSQLNDAQKEEYDKSRKSLYTDAHTIIENLVKIGTSSPEACMVLRTGLIDLQRKMFELATRENPNSASQAEFVHAMPQGLSKSRTNARLRPAYER